METTNSGSAEVTTTAGTTPKCVYLGIKVRPGPVERHRLDDFPLHNTVTALKQQAEIRANVPSDSLDVIHHGKILSDDATLAGSGVRGGEMLHVVRRKLKPAQEPAPTFSDAELHQIVTSLRTFGCTPNAPGWTRAMQVLDDEARMQEILDSVPGLAEDCVSVSMLHEIELLAALGATLHTMRRGAAALPALPAALRQLTSMVRAQPATPALDTAAPTSGFAYSLEALSEDEDVDEEEEEGAARQTITQEQFAAALRMAQEVASGGGPAAAGELSLLQLLRGAGGAGRAAAASDSPASAPGASRNLITTDMFSNAVAEALNRVSDGEFSAPAGTPMDHSTAASSSQSPAPGAADDYSAQLRRMHEVGLVDDALNMRALLICAGDVNAAINFVFTSMEE